MMPKVMKYVARGYDGSYQKVSNSLSRWADLRTDMSRVSDYGDARPRASPACV